jgi:outer membrane protein OmpA-like peptidoglycan-associated protein
MKTTTVPRSGLTPLAKGLIAGSLVLAGVFAARRVVPGLFGGHAPITAPSVPPPAPLAKAPAQLLNTPVPIIAPPVATGPGCADHQEVRMLIWAWNAQQGLLFANGGAQATADSLMCKHGVNLQLTRQDAVDQMQAELINCASELAGGAPECGHGAHYVAIMGDGAAAFFAAVNPRLAALCPDCTAEIIGSAGYSRGEDKFMGLPAWRQDPKAARGALVAGYLRDGDWNIAMKWAGDNGLCNNPDETTYDPACLNWVAASDYLDAGAKYVTGYCEERPVVSSGVRTGDRQQVCVNGVVTWTPGDVNVAHGKGGLVSIASTKEYAYQMPNVIIGLKKWDRAHKDQVIGLLRATTDGGQQVKQNPAARLRAAEISAAVYHEQDAAYWARYFDIVVEKDAQGLSVELGGSTVSNLADNRHLFGLADGVPVEKSVFGATYTVFGNIVVHYYPALVPSFPPVASVVDTAYLEAVAKDVPVAAPAELPTYPAANPAVDAARDVVGRRAWRINFLPGQAAFTPDATKVLDELFATTAITRTVLEINGHTDADGDAEVNRELSRRRALAVRDYLMKRSPDDFTETRFRITGFGEDAPVVPNDSAAHKAQNRRVEIVMRAQ